MQAFRSHHQHFGDELIKAVIDQHVGDFITNFGDGLIPCLCIFISLSVYVADADVCFRFSGQSGCGDGTQRSRSDIVRRTGLSWTSLLTVLAGIIVGHYTVPALLRSHSAVTIGPGDVSPPRPPSGGGGV